MIIPLFLLGQFKGKVGCIVCLDETSYLFLDASNNLVYMRHKHFLPRGHKYRLRMMDRYFDNTDEVKSTAPSGNIKGKKVFKIVSNINLF